VLVMSMTAGGWAAGLASALAAGAGVGAALSGGLLPLLRSPAVWFPTTLSVETSFANAPALAAAAPAFLTMLNIDMTYGGSLVSSFGTSVSLLMPVLAITLLAICVGAGANLLWARKERGAVATGCTPARRSVVRA
jgi:hypothetical protein